MRACALEKKNALLLKARVGKMNKRKSCLPRNANEAKERTCARFPLITNNENTDEKNDTILVYLRQRERKAYANLGRTQRKKTVVEHQHAKIRVCPFAPPFDTKKHMAASGASDGSIQIWSLETGELIKRHEKF